MIVNIVSFLYFLIAGLLSLLLIWRVIKAKSLTEAICLAIILMPLILRALKIK